jgi:DNA-binding CsgD family transcriptional regulator
LGFRSPKNTDPFSFLQLFQPFWAACLRWAIGWGGGGVFADVFLVVGALLTGVAYALFLKSWADNYHGLDCYQGILSLAMSVIFSGLFYRFLEGLPAPILWATLITMPVMMGFCFYSTPEMLSHPSVPSHGNNLSSTRIPPLLACIAILGTTFGLLSASVPISYQATAWSYGSVIFGCLMLLWFFLMRDDRVMPDTLLVVTSLAVAISILVVQLFLDYDALILIFAAAGLDSILVVALISSSCTASPALFISGKHFCRNLALFFAALLVSSNLGRFFGLRKESSLMMSAVLLVAVCALVAFTNLRIGFGKEIKTKGDDAFVRVCEALSANGGLSTREHQVFVRLVRGHTIKSIAEAFTLSTSTIKSQISSIYSKLGVHSRQELINLVENQLHKPR